MYIVNITWFMFEYINEVYNVMMRHVNRRECKTGYLLINPPGQKEKYDL